MVWDAQTMRSRFGLPLQSPRAGLLGLEGLGALGALGGQAPQHCLLALEALVAQ